MEIKNIKDYKSECERIYSSFAGEPEYVYYWSYGECSGINVVVDYLIMTHDYDRFIQWKEILEDYGLCSFPDTIVHFLEDGETEDIPFTQENFSKIQVAESEQ